MKVLRLVSSAMLAASVFASGGCRTAGVNDLARQDPRPLQPDDRASELLSEHNRNAERVQSLEARPSISVSNRRLAAGVGGKMAFERPRNFKLELDGPMSQVADIGSNDQEFWFWIKDSPEKAVYYCNYDESGASPLSASLQPDWIVEALGLRVVSEQEAAGIKVTPGTRPGTLLLTRKQKTPGGETIYKETVLSEQTHRIQEHRVLASDHKTLLARATITEYSLFPMPSEPGVRPESVYLPKKLHLEWIQEKLAISVTLGGVKLNRTLSPDTRSVLFVEPTYPGFARINLGERAGVTSGPTSVRETMPAPPPRVRLTNPAPLGIDGATRTPRDPAALSADLSPSHAGGAEEVVAPPIPTVVDPLNQVRDPRQLSQNSFAPGIER